MVVRVDSEQIEGIVGVERHETHHYARAVSAEQTVYILHSQLCLDLMPDDWGPYSLKECPYSLALDRGIELENWVQDVPVRVMVRYGRLEPYDPV